MTLSLYSKRLAQENVEDVLAGIETIQDLPREEGDLAFPEVGAILSTARVCRVARINREAAAKVTVLVRWRCPECGITLCDWISPSDDAPRVCKGIPSKGPSDVVCGAIMDEVHRERG